MAAILKWTVTLVLLVAGLMFLVFAATQPDRAGVALGNALTVVFGGIFGTLGNGLWIFVCNASPLTLVLTALGIVLFVAILRWLRH